MTIEDYIHRVGRTGRAGETGTAISFFTNANARLAKELIQVLRESKQNVPEQLYQFRGRDGGQRTGFNARYQGRFPRNNSGFGRYSGGQGDRYRDIAPDRYLQNNDRFDKIGTGDRSDRPERQDRPERSDRPLLDRFERPADRYPAADRYPVADRYPAADRYSDRPTRHDRPERSSDRSDRYERSERRHSRSPRRNY